MGQVLQQPYYTPRTRTAQCYLRLREARIVHHHAQQYVHNALFLHVRQTDIAEGQRQHVEEFSRVELYQCPHLWVQRLVDGS